MPKGFFQGSQILSSRPSSTSKTPRCGICRLNKSCHSPVMEIDGDGRRKILLIGEAPGEDEDEEGVPFVGKTGRELRRIVSSFSGDLQEDCWLMNSLSCRPPNNEEPTTEQIDHCRPLIMKAIEQLDPLMIIPLGNSALQSVLVPLWKDLPGSITTWAGHQIPSLDWNRWICPSFHPSYVLRLADKRNEAGRILLKRHLSSAWVTLARNGRPHGEDVPDYASGVTVLLDNQEIADALDRVRSEAKVISFDYETNRLKPDHSKAEIISCAICVDGKWTISFPFTPGAYRRLRGILQTNRIEKVMHGSKYEDRWTKRVFGFNVRNVRSCSMVTAHQLNPIRGVTSLNFQAFTRLGLAPYDQKIKPFLRGEGGNGQNEIDEIELKDLLTYNGIDALAGFRVFADQERSF